MSESNELANIQGVTINDSINHYHDEQWYLYALFMLLNAASWWCYFVSFVFFVPKLCVREEWAKIKILNILVKINHQWWIVATTTTTTTTKTAKRMKTKWNANIVYLVDLHLVYSWVPDRYKHRLTSEQNVRWSIILLYNNNNNRQLPFFQSACIISNNNHFDLNTLNTHYTDDHISIVNGYWSTVNGYR